MFGKELVRIFQEARSGVAMAPADRAIRRIVKFFFTNSGVFFSMPSIGTLLYNVEQYYSYTVGNTTPHYLPFSWSMAGVALLVAAAQAALEGFHKLNAAMAQDASKPPLVVQVLGMVGQLADEELPQVLAALGERAGMKPSDVEAVRVASTKLVNAA